MSTPTAEAHPPSPKRDHLMATASRLFYRDGYRAVGIDTLLAEAEVAKMTLYNHFASKEDLIVAILQKRSATFLGSLDTAIAAAGKSPQRRLNALFDLLRGLFESDGFKGCAFIRALSEYPDSEHPIHQTAWRHKREMNARIRTIIEAAGARNPAAVADSISLLIDGAIVAAHATRDPEWAERARTSATSLLKAAQP